MSNWLNDPGPWIESPPEPPPGMKLCESCKGQSPSVAQIDRLIEQGRMNDACWAACDGCGNTHFVPDDSPAATP